MCLVIWSYSAQYCPDFLLLENSRWLCPFYRFRHRSITFSSSFSPFPYFPPLFFFSSRQECHIARESFKKSLQGSFKISINIKNSSPIFLYTFVSKYHKAREMWTNYQMLINIMKDPCGASLTDSHTSWHSCNEENILCCLSSWMAIACRCLKARNRGWMPPPSE